MKSNLLSFLLMLSIAGYGQVLSKTSIIYESKDAVVMNNGKEYKVVKETPLYEAVTDSTILLKYTFQDQTLFLNRVLLIEGKDEQKELIEWVKGKMTFYELRESKDSK